MSSLGVLLRPPRTRDAVHPPTPPRESRVANTRSYLRGSGSQPCTHLEPDLPRAGLPSPAPWRGLPLPAPSSHGPGVHSSWPPHPSLPRSSPRPRFLLPPPLLRLSGKRARPALAPTQGAPEAGPGGRFKRPREADGVSAVESPAGRAAAAAKEENAEPAGPTDALTAQLALPPRSSLCGSGEPAGLGAVGRGVLPAGLGADAAATGASHPSVTNGPLSAPLLPQVPPVPESPEPGWKRCRS